MLRLCTAFSAYLTEQFRGDDPQAVARHLRHGRLGVVIKGAARFTGGLQAPRARVFQAAIAGGGRHPARDVVRVTLTVVRGRVVRFVGARIRAAHLARLSAAFPARVRQVLRLEQMCFEFRVERLSLNPPSRFREVT